MQRSAIDIGKLEGSLSAVQNQLQETQGNLSRAKADLQQATDALTSEQAAHVGTRSPQMHASASGTWHKVQVL